MFSKVALILLVFFLISCGQEEKSVSDKVVSETKESVFIVEGLACGKSSVGTGVLISNGILTNAHVIAGTEKLEVIDVNGARSETYPISVDFETGDKETEIIEKLIIKELLWDDLLLNSKLDNSVIRRELTNIVGNIIFELCIKIFFIKLKFTKLFFINNKYFLYYNLPLYLFF